MRILMTQVLIVLLLLLFHTQVFANQWVAGNVTKIQDYAGYANGDFQILITLANQSWSGVGDGATVCTNRFRIKLGEEGVDELAKNRFFSMLVSAYMNSKSAALYVNPDSAPYCNVKIVGIGNSLP